jgi:hypothetical protein
VKHPAQKLPAKDGQIKRPIWQSAAVALADPQMRVLGIALMAVISLGGLWLGRQLWSKQRALTPVAKEFGALPLQGELVVRFDPALTCEEGEVSHVVADAKVRGPLLLSIEPVLPQDQSFAPVTRIIEPEMLTKLSELTLEVRGKGTSHNLGLFICTDRDAKKRCAGKPGYAFGGEDALKSATRDAVYFFQYLQLRPGGLQFFASEPDDKAMREALIRASTSIGSSPKVASLVTDASVKLMQTVGSRGFAPLVIGDKSVLQVRMTVHAPDACPVSTKTLEKLPAGAFVPAGGGFKPR